MAGAGLAPTSLSRQRFLPHYCSEIPAYFPDGPDRRRSRNLHAAVGRQCSVCREPVRGLCACAVDGCATLARVLRRAQGRRSATGRLTRAASGGRRCGRRSASEKQGAVSRLLQTTSNRGHLIAKIDPLGLMRRERPRVLDPGVRGLERGRPGHRVLHRQPQRMDPEARHTARDSGAARAGVLRHDRRRVCARVGYRRAAVAAGRISARAHAAALQRRGAAHHPAPPDGGRGTRALPAHALCRAETLLARRRRGADPVAR